MMIGKSNIAIGGLRNLGSFQRLQSDRDELCLRAKFVSDRWFI